MPTTGARWARTCPGSRYEAGNRTQSPYTFAKVRRATRSFSTPFCAHTTEIVGGAAARRLASTSAVCWLLTARTTTSPAESSAAATSSAAGTATTRVPSGDLDAQPVISDRAEVITAGDEHDLGTALVELGANDPTDRPRTDDDETHGGSLARDLLSAARDRSIAAPPRTLRKLDGEAAGPPTSAGRYPAAVRSSSLPPPVKPYSCRWRAQVRQASRTGQVAPSSRAAHSRRARRPGRSRSGAKKRCPLPRYAP